MELPALQVTVQKKANVVGEIYKTHHEGLQVVDKVIDVHIIEQTDVEVVSKEHGAAGYIVYISNELRHKVVIVAAKQNLADVAEKLIVAQGIFKQETQYSEDNSHVGAIVAVDVVLHDFVVLVGQDIAGQFDVKLADYCLKELHHLAGRISWVHQRSLLRGGFAVLFVLMT